MPLPGPFPFQFGASSSSTGSEPGKVRDFKLDDDGDLAVENGDLALVADRPAVKQGMRIRVYTFLGEIWLDEEQGVPWVQVILQKPADPVATREHLRLAVANTPDVTQAIGGPVEIDSARRASVRFSVADVYSAEPIEVLLGTP